MSSPWRAPGRVLAALWIVTSSPACSAAAPDERADPSALERLERRVPTAELPALRGLEEARRIATDFAKLEPWDARAGADPFALVRLDESRWLGLERGLDAIVVLDERAEVLQRLPAPPRPTGLARGEDGVVWVVGEGGGTISRHRLDFSSTRPVALGEAVSIPGSAALRDVAVGVEGWVYVADRHRGRVRAARLGGEHDLEVLELGDDVECGGALRVQVAGDHLVCVCMLDHAVLAVRILEDGTLVTDAPFVLRHDGPIWSVDAIADEGGIALVLGGVEDRPLDRTDGAFGYIDSHVFAYRIEQGTRGPVADRRAEINVSEHGVITPKALRLRREGAGHVLTVSGYGGDRMVELELDAELRPTNVVRQRDLPAGIAAFEGGIEVGLAADPLLDAWVAWSGSGVEVVPVAHPDDDRTADERVGEALVFTRLMAPWNGSAGKQSRFTCETCHFEGTADGRTHWTGRADVHATTKTLQGLFENRPHFSRALDRTMTQMVHNEFRVANRGSGRDPWFSVSRDDAPWVKWLGAPSEVLDPVDLRRALMAFLMSFAPADNPAAAGRTGFDELERRGAALFAEYCEACHQARLVTDVAESRVPFAQWERHVFGGGSIVWAEDARHRTGIEPYVHREGARTPSLRRLWVKRPYFTNGSAPDLAAVLERVLVGGSFAHAGTPELREHHLNDAERRALAAFLELL